jgi:hypothetical protein
MIWLTNPALPQRQCLPRDETQDQQIQIQAGRADPKAEPKSGPSTAGRQQGVWLYRGLTEPVFWAFVHGRAAAGRPASAGAACVNEYFVLLWREGLAKRDEL